jgi:DNA-binding NtrC family response regulator
VRVLAATSRDLKALVAEGRFREDLYYRLNVLPVRLPALRERLADVEALAEHLLENIAERTGMPQRELAPSAIGALAAHPWPGNIRELRNVLEQAAMLTDNPRLAAEDFARVLPALAGVRAPAGGALRPLPEQIAELERSSIRLALAATGGNKVSAARMLGISRATLYQKMSEIRT